MLRANVGVSRKTSSDHDSRGFTLNLSGEIPATLDDPEAVIERIKELYSVAEEALDRQVSEAREMDRIASRDADDVRRATAAPTVMRTASPPATAAGRPSPAISSRRRTSRSGTWPRWPGGGSSPGPIWRISSRRSPAAASPSAT